MVSSHNHKVENILGITEAILSTILINLSLNDTNTIDNTSTISQALGSLQAQINLREGDRQKDYTHSFLFMGA
jgi:hypothetical protein